jgi:hypothetical protein
MAVRVSSLSQAGPMVQMIFVFRMMILLAALSPSKKALHKSVQSLTKRRAPQKQAHPAAASFFPDQ